MQHGSPVTPHVLRGAVPPAPARAPPAPCPLVPATVALGVPPPAVSPPLPAAGSGLVAGLVAPPSPACCNAERSIEQAPTRHSTASEPRIHKLPRTLTEAV